MSEPVRANLSAATIEAMAELLALEGEVDTLRGENERLMYDIEAYSVERATLTRALDDTRAERDDLARRLAACEGAHAGVYASGSYGSGTYGGT